MIDLIGGASSSGLNFGTQTINALKSHKIMMGLHYQALACHCECMGMDAENSLRPNGKPVYKMKDFKKAMVKFGILDKNGNFII